MANLKNITELPLAESVEGLNLIVNDNGSAKQIAASAIGAIGGGGGGGVFIIDATADDYSISDAAYGDKIKEALLDGKTVYSFNGYGYGTIITFRISYNTVGEAKLQIYMNYVSETGDSNTWMEYFTVSGV